MFSSVRIIPVFVQETGIVLKKPQNKKDAVLLKNILRNQKWWRWRELNPRPDKHYIPPSYRLSRSLFSPLLPERHGAKRIARLLYVCNSARTNLAANDPQSDVSGALRAETLPKR